MPSAFPTPVLAVAANAVRELEGEDALPGLWTLFTKCKESLRDGRRLENMSWRLWHKSMTPPGLASSDHCTTKTPDADELLLNEKSYCPPTPEEAPQRPPTGILDTTSNVLPSTQGSTNLSLYPDFMHGGPESLSPSPSSVPSLSRSASSRRNTFRKGAIPVSVGKILCDLIPAATVPSFSSLPLVPPSPSTLPINACNPTHSTDPPRPVPSISLPLINPLNSWKSLQHPSDFTMQSTAREPHMPSQLPTPETENIEPIYSQLPPTSSLPSDTTDAPIPVSIFNELPAITTNHSSPTSDNPIETLPDNHNNNAIPPPPRLVVVNPTPNPTPHPTPPATPVLHPPVTNHMRQGVQSDVISTLSSPLLRVPGQEALAQAQARARTNQMSSRLRLIACEVTEEEEDVGLNTERSEPGPGLEAPPTLYDQPHEELERKLERPVNTSRHSASSDMTTSSSSHRSSSSSRSESSNTTTATTISELVHPTLVEKHYAFPPSQILPPMTLDTSLSPTTPAYSLESPSTNASISPTSRKLKEKDGGSRSSAGKTISSGSSTSRAAGSVTSNKGSSPSGRPANLARRTSSSGVSMGSRNRIAREGSITSVKGSRSRSRAGETGHTASTMLGMTKTSSGKSTGGRSSTRGKVVTSARAARAKAMSRKQSLGEVVKEAGEDFKRAIMFNIGLGSGSDDGSNTGSRSTRSGSELGIKKDGVPPHFNQHGVGVAGMTSRKGKEREVSPVEEVTRVDALRKDQWKGKEKEIGEVEERHEKSGDQGKVREKGRSSMIDVLAVPARVEDTIADPLLPGSARRQIVITSDSEEYETESDSCSDSDSTDAVDVPVAKPDGKAASTSQQDLQQQQALQQKQLHSQLQQLDQQKQYQRQFLQQLPPQLQGRPHLPPFHRNQAHHQTRSTGRLSRAHLAHQLTEQARERQWTENMFTKLPKSSFQNLTEVARTKSAGLLSQLLNPDLSAFPENHPHRRGFSSGAIPPLGLMTPLAPMQRQPQKRQVKEEPQPTVAQVASQVQLPPVVDEADQDRPVGPTKHSRQSSRNYPLPQRMVALTKASLGATGKTPVASAVMSQLQVGSINGVKQTTTGGVAVGVNGSAGKKIGYKPKGRPPEAVLEDTSDSESDENKLDLSKSVAQEKLKALLEAKRMKKSTQIVQANSDQGAGGHRGISQPAQPAEALPIPMPRTLFPYDLPAPNPPTTPRTTRRRMLQTEMPESLRRNLLWERKVSQAHPRGLRRSASSGDVSDAPRPVWVIPSVVRLTLKGTKPEERQETQEEKRARFLARNRSWAYEYHYVGW